MKPITSPPRAARPPMPATGPHPRRRLIELARAIAHRPTRQQLLEYLALRRHLHRPTRNA